MKFAPYGHYPNEETADDGFRRWPVHLAAGEVVN